ncbi:MAG: MFS transporter [Patescibacteria group bacterium]|nr:MFS transporter [Patescibacteria group bacterium]
MKIKIDVTLKVTHIVKTLVLSDLFLMAGWGFISPVFPVFIINKIAGATLTTVGITTAIYWLTRSIIQLPIANFLDRTEGEKDDFYALVGALILAGIAAFGYIAISNVPELYFFQIVQAVAFGIYTPAWSGIFSRHLDEKRKSFDYSLDSTAIGISSGVAGLLGGAIAQHFGFNIIFLSAGLFSLLAAFIVFTFPKLVLPPKTSNEPAEIRDHKPPMVG